MEWPQGEYRVILADPPWQYNDQGTRLSPAYEGKDDVPGMEEAYGGEAVL